MENNTAQLEARVQKLESELARVGSGTVIAAIERNRVQQINAAAAVVAAGAAITPDAALTTVGPLGKVRISANWSGVAAGIAAGVHAFLQVKIGAGAFITEYSWAPFASAAHFDESAVFEFDSGGPPGTLITVHWQTTAGDDAVTLGGAAAPLAAVLLVEELP